MLKYFFMYPLFLLKVGMDVFHKFAQSHLERLIANKPEEGGTLFGVSIITIFETMIADMQAKFSSWASGREVITTVKAQREGKTISLNSSIKGVKKFIAMKYGVIKDKYQNMPAVLEEFYPQKLKDYSRVTKKSADKLFKRFINAVTAHQSDFDAAFIAEANELYAAYLGSYDAQLQKIGKEKDGISSISDARKALTLQLFKNLLTLVLINADDPSKAAIYFDLSLFKNKSKKTAVVESSIPAK